MFIFLPLDLLVKVQRPLPQGNKPFIDMITFAAAGEKLSFNDLHVSKIAKYLKRALSSECVNIFSAKVF